MLKNNYLSTCERNKKKYDAKFKAKVALEAIKERVCAIRWPQQCTPDSIYGYFVWLPQQIVGVATYVFINI